jgi:hypothetical protein
MSKSGAGARNALSKKRAATGPTCWAEAWLAAQFS